MESIDINKCVIFNVGGNMAFLELFDEIIVSNNYIQCSVTEQSIDVLLSTSQSHGFALNCERVSKMKHKTKM